MQKIRRKNTRENFHGALLDATLLSKVYLKLTTGKQENLDLIDNELANPNKNKNVNNFKESFLIPRDQLMNLSNHEKEEHQRFIREMTDPLWKKI